MVNTVFTKVTFFFCKLGQDPESDSGDSYSGEVEVAWPRHLGVGQEGAALDLRCHFGSVLAKAWTRHAGTLFFSATFFFFHF